jgi:hypothetical protein
MKLLFLTCLLSFSVMAQEAPESAELIFDGNPLEEIVALSKKVNRTVTTPVEVPSTCTRQVTIGSREVCENVPDQECQTTPERCEDVTRQYCNPGPDVCQNVPREVCDPQSPICRTVNREVCDNVPRERCSTETRRECSQPEPVCHTTTRRECSTQNRQECSNGPEVCENRTRQECQPGERTCRRICDENSPRCMQCEAGPRVCRDVSDRVCRPGERSCRQVPEQVCRDVQDRQCSTPSPVCRDVPNRVCHTEYERVCRNVNEQDCHTPSPICRTVSQRECYPGPDICENRTQRECEGPTTQCRDITRRECRDVPVTRDEQYACTRIENRTSEVFDHIQNIKSMINISAVTDMRTRETLLISMDTNLMESQIKLQNSKENILWGKKTFANIEIVNPELRNREGSWTVKVESLAGYRQLAKNGLNTIELSESEVIVVMPQLLSQKKTFSITLTKMKRFGRDEVLVQNKELTITSEQALAQGLVEVHLAHGLQRLESGRYELKIKTKVEPIHSDLLLLSPELLKAVEVEDNQKLRL